MIAQIDLGRLGVAGGDVVAVLPLDLECGDFYLLSRLTLFFFLQKHCTSAAVHAVKRFTQLVTLGNIRGSKNMSFLSQTNITSPNNPPPLLFHPDSLFFPLYNRKLGFMSSDSSSSGSHGGRTSTSGGNGLYIYADGSPHASLDSLSK